MTPWAVTTQNSRGEWVPDIPVPFYGLRKRCECGRRFWTADGYRGHYALTHILLPPVEALAAQRTREAS